MSCFLRNFVKIDAWEVGGKTLFHLPKNSEKMQSHQIMLKLGRETKFGARNLKIRVLTLFRMGYFLGLIQ